MAKHDAGVERLRVQMIDLQYHDIRPGKGLYYKLEEVGRGGAAWSPTTRSPKAIYDPPKDTRAYFRGMCLQRYADEIVSASWDSVIFDLKEGPLKKIFMLEPLRGTEAHVRQLLTESPTASATSCSNIVRPRMSRAGRWRTMTDDRRLQPVSRLCRRPASSTLLRRQSPHLLPGADVASPAGADAPHGTTVLAPCATATA